MEEVVIHPPEPPIGTLEQITSGLPRISSERTTGSSGLVGSAEPLLERGARNGGMPCASVKIGTSVGSLRIAQLERLDIHVEVRSYYLEMENCLSSLTCATAPGASNSPCSPTGT